MPNLGEREHVPNQQELHFVGDVCEQMLHQPGVFVAVSVVVQSPLKEPSGALSLVAYLESLPYPSVILVVDSPIRHNVMAVRKMRNKHHMSLEEARRIALERGNLYVKAISDAISIVGSTKVTVIRWDDMYDDNKAKQVALLREYYNTSTYFRQRVDEIAMEFVNQRLPNSRYISHRMSHAVKYILDELPMFLTGLSYKQKRYVTSIYATSTISLEKAEANPDAPVFWNLMIDIHSNPMFSDLMKKLVDADDGIVASNGLAILAIAPKPATNMEEC